MKITKVILLITIILANSKFVSSQEELDSLYGLNPVLYNGQIFNSYLSRNMNGHQFLFSEEFKSGTIDISGKHFENVYLNYDIYNQEILIKIELNKRTIILKLFKDRIEKFTLDGKLFEIVRNENSNDLTIYQAIGDDQVRVFYSWSKTLKVSSMSLQSSHSFSPPMRKMYLRINDQMHFYRNTRTFISKFNESVRKDIKRYIKSNKINVRKSSNHKIEELVKFCNTQLP